MQRCSELMTNYAIIMAAGHGERFGGCVPKQYSMLAGRPVLRWAIEPFLRHPQIAGTLVVIDPEHRALYDEAVRGLELLPPAFGGPTRQASVRQGLAALAKYRPGFVLVHDGARPWVQRPIIDRVLAALGDAVAVVPTLPVTDTLRRFSGGHATADVDRAELHRVQTPQGFDYHTIVRAHDQADPTATDDGALVMARGGKVVRVAGGAMNIKVTVPDDLVAGEAAVRHPPLRWATGSGFDVHRFAAGRRLVLLGVEVAHELGLEGHSDADVGLHALTDAVLGAICAGDIGQHFPPSEERWRDADSARFLRHGVDLAAAAGATIEHVDVTIIGERPKIGPYRTMMRQRIAEIMILPIERVSVKATTTERLGFAGRGEGLAAHAMATLAFRS